MISVVHARNLQQALPEACYRLQNAPHTEPMLTQLLLPMERVLFHPERDANPFLEMINSLVGLHDMLYYDDRYVSEAVRHLIKDSTHQAKIPMGPGRSRLLQVVDGKLDLIETVPTRRLWSSGLNRLSVIQEYFSAATKLPMGTLHVLVARPYEMPAVIDKVAALADKTTEIYKRGHIQCPYAAGKVKPTQLVNRTDLAEWRGNLDDFMEGTPRQTTPEFRDMWTVREAYGEFTSGTMAAAQKDLGQLPKDSDIRVACDEWLMRRTQ